MLSFCELPQFWKLTEGLICLQKSSQLSDSSGQLPFCSLPVDFRDASEFGEEIKCFLGLKLRAHVIKG